MPKRMVGLECVLALLAAPFPRRSASEEDLLMLMFMILMVMIMMKEMRIDLI